MTINALWFAALAGMLAAYAALDGYDLGCGALHWGIARDDRERRLVIVLGGEDAVASHGSRACPAAGCHDSLLVQAVEQLRRHHRGRGAVDLHRGT